MAAFSMQLLSAQVSYSIKGIDVQKGYLFPSNPREINSFSFKAAVPIESNGDWASARTAFGSDGRLYPSFCYGGKVYVIDGGKLVVRNTENGYLYKNAAGDWQYVNGRFKKDGIEIEGILFTNKEIDEFVEKMGEFTDRKILSGKTYRYTFGTLGEQQMLIIYGGSKI